VLPTVSDQWQWAQFWSSIMARYNSGGPAYCSWWGTNLAGKPVCSTKDHPQSASLGMSQLVRLGLSDYTPGAAARR
jgi:hypothetical protein